jgi:hypothetical protein
VMLTTHATLNPFNFIWKLRPSKVQIGLAPRTWCLGLQSIGNHSFFFPSFGSIKYICEASFSLLFPSNGKWQMSHRNGKLYKEHSSHYGGHHALKRWSYNTSEFPNGLLCKIRDMIPFNRQYIS